MNRFFSRKVLTIATIAFTVALASCGGNSLSGDYFGTGPFPKMSFKPGGKVEVTTMIGTTMEATYEVDKKSVKVNNGGQILVLTIDDQGCLVSGGLMGKFCKK